MESITKPQTCYLFKPQYANRPGLRETSEEEHIRQAQLGNLEAFNALVLHFQDQVYRQALWILNDEASAEDACQEAFLAAYRKLHTFRGGPFLPWLLRIVTNICIDQIRSAKRRPCQPLELTNQDGEELEPASMKDPAESPERIVERAETGEAIFQSMQRLAPVYRTAVILIDLQEMDYAEASTILQIPMGTFKSRLARARALLRLQLSKTMAEAAM